MSYYCKFCGKILTTADEIDRCKPSCITQSIIFQEIKDINFGTMEYQYSQLKAENEKLKENKDALCDTIDELIDVLNNIYDLTHTSQDRHDIFVLVDEALKEVTK